MKPIERLIAVVLLGSVALIIAAEELPKLVIPSAVIFAMAVIGRLVWFFTQRW